MIKPPAATSPSTPSPPSSPHSQSAKVDISEEPRTPKRKSPEPGEEELKEGEIWESPATKAKVWAESWGSKSPKRKHVDEPEQEDRLEVPEPPSKKTKVAVATSEEGSSNRKSSEGPEEGEDDQVARQASLPKKAKVATDSEGSKSPKRRSTEEPEECGDGKLARSPVKKQKLKESSEAVRQRVYADTSYTNMFKAAVKKPKEIISTFGLPPIPKRRSQGVEDKKAKMEKERMMERKAREIKSSIGRKVTGLGRGVSC